MLGEEYEIVAEMKGEELLGLRYEPPFGYLTDYGERGHTVLAGDFVSLDDGTGVVHTGAAFGEDDFRVAFENGVTVHNPVLPDGTFDERMGEFAGRPRARPRRARNRVARASAGRVFRVERYLHSYPHCWRCDTPLIYYAKQFVVREDDGRQGRAAREQRGDQLVPRAHQARPHGQVARGQRRLGTLARPLLGHAASGLALHRRRGARALRRVARRAVGAGCHAAR